MNDDSLRIYDDVLGLLPNENNPTPLVRLNKVVPFKHTKVYAKLEWYNPWGAVKCRIGANLLEDAIAKGLTADKKLVEPTSGNTGIGLADAANVRGFGLRTILSSAIPDEKKNILRFLGAQVIETTDTLCPDPASPTGAIGIAKSTAKNLPDKFHMLNQYENDANWQAHYKTTGPEIWKQTQGKITHFVAGLGTCGTITGNTKYLREQNPDVNIIGVHPEEGHDIPGVRSIKQLTVSKFYDPDSYNDRIEVSNKEAYDLCLRLNREEGLIAGPSSGMALAGALKSIEDKEGSIVVIIFPDNIFKYISSFAKHFPNIVKVSGVKLGPSPQEEMLNTMIESGRNSYNTIDLDEAKEVIAKDNPLLLDIRTADIYANQHLPNAINIPTLELPSRISELPDDKNTPIITICNRGNQSMSGMLMLKSLGYNNVKSLNGGTLGWAAKGFDTISETPSP